MQLITSALHSTYKNIKLGFVEFCFVIKKKKLERRISQKF